MDPALVVAVVRAVAKGVPYAMYGLLLLSGLLQWWDFFGWLFGSMLVGATLASIVAKIQRDFSKVPLIGGYSGIIGVILHVLFRVQMWFG